MNDLTITITIPCNGEPKKAYILSWLGDLLEETLTELCDFSDTVTLADNLGFGGNVLMLECGDDVREICL